jgi:hypothetical protein
MVEMMGAAARFGSGLWRYGCMVVSWELGLQDLVRVAELVMVVCGGGLVVLCDW